MVNWEKAGQPARAARAALSYDVIAAGGIGLADAEGLDAVTMRKVAVCVGAGAMSLYRYVDSREDLISLMVDRVSAEVAVPPRTGDWRADLTAMAHTTRQVTLRHPWLARQALTADAFGPGTIAMTEASLSLLDGYGFTMEQMLEIWRTVIAFVQGYTHAEARRLEAAKGSTTRPAGQDGRAAAPSYLDRVAESGEYPLTSRALRETGDRPDPRQVFDRRLGYLLDGLAHTFFPRTPDDLLTLSEVEALARRVHASQTDKAGQPYTVHLAAVAAGVVARGGTDDQTAAAWLHDSVEDGALSADWLEGAPLSRGVKDMVFAMTKRAGESPEAYAARLLAVPGALLIKESDIAHNADPKRLAVLDAPTRDRLTAKYARMRCLLGLGEG